MTEGGDDKESSRAWVSGVVAFEGGGVELPDGRLLDDTPGTARGGGLSFGKELVLVAPVVTLEARYATEDWLLSKRCVNPKHLERQIIIITGETLA